MFKRSFRSNDQNRVDKSARLKKGLAGYGHGHGFGYGQGDHHVKMSTSSSLSRQWQKSMTEQDGGHAARARPPRQQQQQQHYYQQSSTGMPSPPSLSPIVTLTVGREGRLFAAHEDVLCQSPFFQAACRGNFYDAASGTGMVMGNGGKLGEEGGGAGGAGKRIALPDEEPEVFSAVLEFLYKGDYYPRLVKDKRRDTWELEDQGASAYPSPADMSLDSHAQRRHHQHQGGNGGGSAAAAMVFLESVGEPILRDTVVYCAATRYELDDLARLALKKQGLQSGIDVGTILRSAQYAYANTPDSDSRLRAHYLALIIRCRKTFKRSGTMQAEMERGGSKLFFDLFVAMCNHLDDVIDGVAMVRTPKTV